MPKPYTEKERQYITDKLKKEAGDCLKKYGVKKTTVDELVKRAGIPKGTFYLFYRSKEELLLQVINEWQSELHDELLKKAEILKGSISAYGLTELLFDIYNKVDRSGFIELLTEGEIDLLMRKLSDDMLIEHLRQDDFSMEKLLSFFTKESLQEEKIKVYSAALRAVFLSMKYKREIGDDCFNQAIWVLLHGVSTQIIQGD